MRERGIGRGLAVAAALAALLTGCGGGTGGRAAYVDHEPLPADTMNVAMHELGKYGGRFVYGETAGPKTFNAIMSNETSSNDVCNLLYTALTDIDYKTLEDIPVLAKSWEFSDSSRTVTFHIRHGAKFSDGHPMTSVDVMFSFDVVMSDSLHPSTQDALTSLIDGKRVKYRYSAPDSFTFVISSPRQDALILAHVGSVRIMPRHVLEAAFRAGNYASAYATSTPPESLVTSGPFKLESYLPEQKTVLTRNPYWFGVDARGRRLPYLDQVVFLIAKDQDVAALKFHSGELDGLDNVKPDDYKEFAAKQQAEDFTLYDIGPSFNTNFMWFNLNTLREARDGRKAGEPAVEPWKFALFNNPVFRRAVSMAIDREALIRGPFHGFAEKNWGILTSGNARWYDPTIHGPDHDVEQARQLLASLGLKDRNGDKILEDAQGHPVSFGIVTNADNRVRIGLLDLIKDDLAQVGIEVLPQPVDFNTLVTKTRSDFTYDVALLGLGSAVPADPGMGQNVIKSSGLTHYWHVRQTSPATDAERRMDALMEANVVTLDLAERKRTWHDLSQILDDQAFFIWLPTQLMKIPVRSRFGNVDPSPMPNRILWNADRIYQKRPPKGA